MTKPLALDATLDTWRTISKKAKWTSLLIGNGASQAVWKGFGYDSLYLRASSDDIDHPLAEADLALFNSMAKTRNFELVLGNLATAMGVNSLLSIDSAKIQARYKSIRNALIEAVHSSHIPWNSVSSPALTA